MNGQTLFTQRSALKWGLPMSTYLLADGECYDKVVSDHGIFPGVYQLHFRNSKGVFEVIPRLLGEDTSGTLYIGTSVSVPYRIGNLRKSVCAAYKKMGYKDPSPHQCGKKIVQCSRFMERFPFEGLCITVQQLRADSEEVGQRDGDHTKLEWRLLSEYFSKFGEFPPLNG
jgi:hypothetical protein